MEQARRLAASRLGLLAEIDRALLATAARALGGFLGVDQKARLRDGFQDELG